MCKLGETAGSISSRLTLPKLHLATQKVTLVNKIIEVKQIIPVKIRQIKQFTALNDELEWCHGMKCLCKVM